MPQTTRRVAIYREDQEGRKGYFGASPASLAAAGEFWVKFT
ncbi:MAG: hypothetical protein KIH69_021555 [Anaerolineae bacterium]|nr:hypothetical protein [Anaerolineae bacterium]